MAQDRAMISKEH